MENELRKGKNDLRRVLDLEKFLRLLELILLVAFTHVGVEELLTKT